MQTGTHAGCETGFHPPVYPLKNTKKEQENKLENVAMPAPANFHTLSQVFHAIGVAFCAV